MQCVYRFIKQRVYLNAPGHLCLVIQHRDVHYLVVGASNGGHELVDLMVRADQRQHDLRVHLSRVMILISGDVVYGVWCVVCDV